MGWDEALFGIVYRAFRGKKGVESRQAAALLEPQRTKLALFGAAIARQKIEIAVAEREGYRSGVTLRLPEAMELAPDAASNARAYLVRVALDATSLRLGMDPVRQLADGERTVFALLALPATLAALDEDLPGVRGLFDALAPFVVASRPSLARMANAAQLLEVLTRRSLGVSWSDLAREASPSAIERARSAAAAVLVDGASLTRAAAELASGLGSARVAPVVLWGTIEHEPGARGGAGLASSETPDATGTERKGKPREGIRRITLDDAPLEDNPLTHSFEKVHTVEEYSGGRKNVDGEDELDAHGDALDDIEMREVVRSRERARSLYRAEVTFDDDQAGVEVDGPAFEGGVAYDEWDERARSYRKAHCRVFVSHAPRPADVAGALANVRAVLHRSARRVHEIESRFERIERARRERGRQPDGTDIDVDVMVERHAALAAGHTGDDRLYVARRPHVQDLAVLLLLDASLSSDAWVDGRRVLDVAKEAVIVLGEALSGLPVQAGVAAFFSNTRRDCRFVVVKSFDAEWRSATARLATVAPTGYTRIGPAIRHGAHMLDETKARRKLLLMIGDGKPTDFDRYEGRYGIADVHKAVGEASLRGIHSFALAIDASARRQLPQMFGPKGFEVLARPEDLVTALGRICADLAR